MSVKSGWTAPTITKQKYDVHTMTLSDALMVLCEHFFTFEQICDMTFQEIGKVFEQINAGEIKSVKQAEAERKAKVTK